jgi:hypothetical protein
VRRIAVLVSVAVVSIATSARAQTKEGETPEPAGKEFGNPGTVNIGAVTGLDFSYTSISPAKGDSTNALAFSISPELAYFVIEGLSLGVVGEFRYLKVKGTDAITAIGAGPVVGYNIWLSPGKLSLWPQITPILFSSETSSSSSATSTSGTGTTTTTTSSVTETRLSTAIAVPLLIHPAEHFHIGIGPYFRIDFSSKVSGGSTSGDSDKNTSFGIQAEVAGWL